MWLIRAAKSSLIPAPWADAAAFLAEHWALQQVLLVCLVFDNLKGLYLMCPTDKDDVALSLHTNQCLWQYHHVVTCSN